MRFIVPRTLLLLLLSLAALSSATANGGSEAAALESGEYTIWQGDPITFTKEDGADPDLPENQDRITDGVWITRDNDGGQIYNVAERDSAVKTASPVGTLWALGTTADLPDLDLASFRTAVGSPKDVVGKELVMFIEAEAIFMDVTFLSWSQEKLGGFSYERSTPGDSSE